MAGIGSSGYDLTRLSELIKNYVNYESASSRAILSNMIIDGDDLIDALDNASLDMETDGEEYEKLEEKHENLIKNIESLIKGKEGSFVEKIKNILKEAKEE